MAKNVVKTKKSEPVKKRKTRTKMVGQPIPKGLANQQTAGIEKLNTASVAKKKPNKKVKPSKKSLERRFWTVIIVAVVIIFGLGLYWVFDGYWKDSLTPAQIQVKMLDDKKLNELEAITSENAVLKDATATTSGPIIYIMYYVDPATTYESVQTEVQNVLNTIRGTYPPYLDTYDINFNIQANPKEPDGVNNYPYSGLWSSKNQNISWQARGVYVPVAPVE